MPDSFSLPLGGWDNLATENFFNVVIPDILAEAAQDALTVSHTLPTPLLRTKAGPSTVSPTPGQLRSSISWWLDHDLNGSYAALGVRGHLARVVMWLGGAGDRLSMARQVRKMQDFLVQAVEATRGWPL
jgi:hypothetical protein